MLRKGILYGAVLIGGYLVLVHYVGAVKDTNAAGKASVNLIKAFQGR
jgi:hypothetical protein